MSLSQALNQFAQNLGRYPCNSTDATKHAAKQRIVQTKWPRQSVISGKPGKSVAPYIQQITRRSYWPFSARRESPAAWRESALQR